MWADWRTTLLGIAGGVAEILVPTVQGGQSLHTQDWISAGIFMIMGILAKDSNFKKEVL